MDILVATAEKLMQVDKEPEAVKFLPHGVDYDHFSAPLLKETPVAYLNEFIGPRIGFFGLLNSWLDFNFINDIAVQNPEWSIIIIGPSQLSESDLPSAPNLHYLGPIPYDKLPEYASQFDVGLIPFKINNLTLAVNPLKLMEYFAIGLPVVSTPLPEVMKYKDLVYITSNAKDARVAIKNALNQNNILLREQRQKIAAERSWKAKSEELKSWIETGLEKKSGA